METIKIILFGFKTSLSTFFSGKFFIYLLPGIFISLVYYLIFFPLSWLFDGVSLVTQIPWIGEWFESPLDWTESTLFWLYLELYKFAMLTLLSPVMARLSEKVDHHLTGNVFNAGFSQFFKDILRSIGIFIPALIGELLIYLVWSYVARQTNLEMLTPIILFISSAFFVGFSFFDYSLERYHYTPSESWGYGFKRFKFMFVAGTIFSLLFSIPVIGIIIAPVLMTIFATSLWIRIRKGETVKGL